MRIYTLLLAAVVMSAQARLPSTPADSGGNLPAQPVGASDLLSITVYGAPELSRALRVTPEGSIRLPMLKQSILVRGLMPLEIETKLAESLSAEQILVDPVVTVTIAEIADKSGVAGSTVYAVFKSKEGILRELMEQSLFGDRFQSAQQILAAIKDPVEAIARTSHVARAIYESESSDLGLLRNVSGFSPALRKIEEEFERMRFEMQKDRLFRLFKAGRSRRGISLDEARRILWMYTSRDIYRMLVIEGEWTPSRYEEWLEQTLLAALVEGGSG